MVVLITGGARSGKSSFAEKYAAHLSKEGLYIATTERIHKGMEQSRNCIEQSNAEMEYCDAEMKHRIMKHVERRNQSPLVWETIEEPYHLAERLKSLSKNEAVILVDCLTIWLSNWLIHYEGEEAESKTADKINQLVQALASFEGDLLLVTNEVGSGIVPEYRLGRQFRDLAGMMNQQIAAVSEQVFLVTAGIPIELKSFEYKLDQTK
jgi:adenosylcobinamide kinase/adenosylcobinamide-phosphate guanylyltransferase